MVSENCSAVINARFSRTMRTVLRSRSRGSFSVPDDGSEATDEGEETEKGVIAHPLLKPQMEATYFFFFAAFLAAFLAAMVCNPPFRSRYRPPLFPTFCVDNKDMH